MKKFTWGWITNDGVRCKRETNATPDKIIGIWSEQGDAYYETFLKECLPESGTVNNWTIRPMATLLDTNKERLHFFAKNKRLIVNEIVDGPKPIAPEKVLQKWKCECGHSFYTTLAKSPNFLKRIWAWIRSYFCPEYIDCEICHARTATKSGVKVL